MTQPVNYGLALPDNLLFCFTGIALSFENTMYHVSEGNTTILTVLRSVVITEMVQLQISVLEGDAEGWQYHNFYVAFHRMCIL